MEREKCHCHGLFKRCWMHFPAMTFFKGKNYRLESADGFANGSLVSTTGLRWSSDNKITIRVHNFQAYFQAYKAAGRCHLYIDGHGSHKNVQALQFYEKTASTKKVFSHSTQSLSI